MNLTQVNCPACGAPISAPLNRDSVQCTYCGNIFITRHNTENAAQEIRISSSSASTLSAKDWRATLALALFFGMWGVHRFYTGHVWAGIIQLLTGGGFGLWWLIDLVLLLTNHYHDAQDRLLNHYSPRIGRSGVSALIVGLITLLIGVVGVMTLNQFLGLVQTSFNQTLFVATESVFPVVIGASFVLACIAFVYVLIAPAPILESIWEKLKGK